MPCAPTGARCEHSSQPSARPQLLTSAVCGPDCVVLGVLAHDVRGVQSHPEIECPWRFAFVFAVCSIVAASATTHCVCSRPPTPEMSPEGCCEDANCAPSSHACSSTAFVVSPLRASMSGDPAHPEQGPRKLFATVWHVSGEESINSQQACCRSARSTECATTPCP